MTESLRESSQKVSKPYHEMTLGEYAGTDRSQAVPRWSVLALPPESYTRTQLCQLVKEALSAVAFLWGVKREGSKEQLADRILRRVKFRLMLAEETQISRSRRLRTELVEIAKEAGVYHPWLNRENLAAALIRCRHARLHIAETQHEGIVRAAARKGLRVPSENLARYGLDATGQREPTILCVPLSQALRTAPEAFDAARTLTAADFEDWVRSHSDLATKLVFIGPRILGDGGDLFWREVQTSFASPAELPLFVPHTD